MVKRGLRGAEESFVAGRLDEVVDICGELIADDPECHQAFYLLGRACMTLGNFDEAREMIVQATRIKADAAPYHTELGHLLAAKGELNAAVDAYRTAVELSPEFVDPLVNLGAALQLLDRTEEAVSVYESAVELAPDAALLHFNLAEARTELGVTSLAVDGYRRAVELEPNWSELQRKLGLALLNTGELDAAQDACCKAVSLAPEDAKNHVALARALVAVGDFCGALGICDAYLSSQAFNVAVEACRALVLNEMGSRDAAVRSLGLDAFVRTAALSAPVAFCSLSAFNNALAAESHSQCAVECEPSWPMKFGRRESGELFRKPLATNALLMEQIDKSVGNYVKEFSETDNHWVITRKPRNWRLSGYSIELAANGRLDAHIRADSWLGGLYIAKSDKPPKVTLGEPPPGWGFLADPIAQLLRPEVGEFILFPGHVYCSVTAEVGGNCFFYVVQIIRE